MFESIQLKGLLPLLLIAGAGGICAKDRPPNLILIMADDLGYETIGANGGESYQTPHLDRLAATGMRYEHCYSQPICTPSRVQIMTGKYNDRNYTRFGELKRGQTTFAHLLKNAGYATCIVGKWQLGKEKDAPQHFGFEESLLWQHTRGRVKKDKAKRYDSRYENPYLERNGVEEEYSNGAFGPDLCVDFICDFIDKNKDEPFLVYYPMMLTHCPFVPMPGSEDWDPDSPGSVSYKGNARYFGDMVNYMDKLVDRIVDRVEKLGLAENTVIIFTGDNGTDRPVVSKWQGMDWAGAKGKTTDGGTRVPLIVHAPGLEGRGVSPDLVDFTDMLPTLCELAGIDLKQKDIVADGHSFAPQLKGENTTPRDHIFCWYSRSGQAKKDLKVFARTQRYKLYRDGRFFDVSQDRLEKNPLDIEHLTAEQQAIQKELKKLLTRRRELSGR